jgi:secreted trypsin-like serine protease
MHDHATCQAKTPFKVTENMFCAGYSSEVVEGSACKGDSGGPFIMKYDNVWYLVGLVSWGNPNRRCDRVYGYYTKMAKYYDWVIDNTGML